MLIAVNIRLILSFIKIRTQINCIFDGNKIAILILVLHFLVAT